MTTPEGVDAYVAGLTDTEFAALIARTRVPRELDALQRARAGVSAGVAKLLALEVDHNGFVTPAPDPEPAEGTQPELEPPPAGMKPNPAQGGSAMGATVPKPPTTADKADLLRKLTAQMNRGA